MHADYPGLCPFEFRLSQKSSSDGHWLIKVSDLRTGSYVVYDEIDLDFALVRFKALLEAALADPTWKMGL
jgi:hypothetical protein